DHVPDNIFNWITVRNYGFSDATEIFVFISGYTAVIAYGRMMMRDGWLRAAARIFRRVWHLDAAPLLLFRAFTPQIASISLPRPISAGSTAGAGRSRRQPLYSSALPPLSPCPGTTIRWGGLFRTGSRGCSTRSTRPTSISCGFCILSRWHG